MSIYKNWVVHNVIAHPLMQLFNCIGLRGAVVLEFAA